MDPVPPARLAAIVSVAVMMCVPWVAPRLLLADGPMDSALPTSRPAFSDQGGTQRPVSQIAAEYSAVSRTLNSVLTPVVLIDPVKRNQAAPRAIPIVYQREGLVEELAATRKLQPLVIAQHKRENQALLYLLGDASTVGKVKGMIDSGDPVRQAEGQSIALSARWLTVGNNRTEASKVVDDIEQLDRAHPTDSRLTLMTLNLGQSSSSPDITHRLLSLVTEVQTDQLAARVRPQLLAELKGLDTALARQQAMLNQPLTLTGKTYDGKDFSTAADKGKVILVDFWATWCPSCMVDIPRLQAIYLADHAKRLEVIGVDNDFDSKALVDFITRNNMPWPQMFDADSAANHKWNPLSGQSGVISLPALFLIDKKGVLRSVTASDDLETLVPKLLAE